MARVVQISIENLSSTELQPGSVYSQDLRDRFGIPLQLLYEPDDIKEIIMLNSHKLNFELNEDAAKEIAKRARGTPRIAIRLLKRIIDFSIVK